MSNGVLITNCGQILTLTGSELGIIYNGAVRIRGEKIVEAGTGLQLQVGEEVLDAKGCVVLPGFVDPHTHLVFGGWRADEFEMRLAGKSYKEIAQAGGGILATVRATRQASEEELYTKALEFLKEMVSWGTTTVEVKSGYGLDTETELKILRGAQRLGKMGLAEIVPTFLGAHSVPEGVSKQDYVRLIIEKMIPAVAEAGLAQFCDVFCENFVFDAGESRQILQAGKQFGLLPTIHADEIESSGGAEVAAEVGAVSASHLLKPSDTGLEAMAKTGVTAVLLPGTCFFLQERQKPPVARMRELGIDIALGSDFNPGSSTLLAPPLTLQLGCIHYGLTIVEAIRGVTVNAARALRRDSDIGTIKPGKRADIVITDVPDYRHLAYRLGHNPVRMVIHKGRIVYHKGEKNE